MEREASTEAPESPPTHVPVQNFPDYLRYVMMKSMAGFGKVHDELSKLYYGASDIPSRSSQQIDSQETPNGNWRKLRKRLSLKESFGPSAGSPKTLPVRQTFTSYILEEDEDSDSVRRSDLHTMASLSDLTKISNCSIGADKETHSAPPIGVRKDMFKFDEYRESMPHAELITEAIYINDRVLHVEQENDNKNDGDINGSPVYASPIPKSERNETNDYINLNTAQDLTESDDYVDMGESIPSLEQPDSNTNKLNMDKSQENSMLTRNNTVSKSHTVTTCLQRNDNAPESEEEHDYADPNSWTLDYVNAPDEPRVRCAEPNRPNNDTNIPNNTSNEMTKRATASIADVNQKESDYDVLTPGARPIDKATGSIRSNNDTNISRNTPNDMTKSVTGAIVAVNLNESDYDALPPGARLVNKFTEPHRSNTTAGISSNTRSKMTNRVAGVIINQTESDYDALTPGARPINTLTEPYRFNKENNIPSKTSDEMVKSVTGPFADAHQKESDYDVLKPGARPINTMTDIEGDYDVPKAFRHNITNINADNEMNEIDIPKPKIYWKLTNNN